MSLWDSLTSKPAVESSFATIRGDRQSIYLGIRRARASLGGLVAVHTANKDGGVELRSFGLDKFGLPELAISEPAPETSASTILLAAAQCVVGAVEM